MSLYSKGIISMSEPWFSFFSKPCSHLTFLLTSKLSTLLTAILTLAQRMDSVFASPLVQFRLWHWRQRWQWNGSDRVRNLHPTTVKLRFPTGSYILAHSQCKPVAMSGSHLSMWVSSHHRSSSPCSLSVMSSQNSSSDRTCVARELRK